MKDQDPTCQKLAFWGKLSLRHSLSYAPITPHKSSNLDSVHNIYYKGITSADHCQKKGWQQRNPEEYEVALA